MSDITIRRKHGKTSAGARASAEHMASELQEEFDLHYAWDGDLMRFKRPGVSGELTLEGEEVTLHIHLGIFLTSLKPSIEREVHKLFDENFAA
jgi:putative polyhydroxyalkanoate system protein